MYWITYVKYVLTGVLSLALFLAGWTINGDRWEAKYSAYKAEVEALGKEQQAKNEALVQKQELINRSTKETYEARIAALKSYYGRLQHSASNGPRAVPKVPEPTSGTHGTASDLTLACSLTTQQLISLQDWVTNQTKE